ncbi:MAG: O-antigen ligase family protein [Hungatella sp.]|jgi:O-antigen ligase|nr:O-antigen ligase family protein [Hungatella sp.]
MQYQKKKSFSKIEGILMLVILASYSYMGANIRAGLNSLMIAFIGFHILLNFHAVKKKGFYSNISWLCILITIYLYQNNDIKQGYYGRFLYFSCAICFLSFMTYTEKWIPTTIYIIKYVGIMMSLFALFKFLDGDKINDGNILVWSIALLGIGITELLFERKKIFPLIEVIMAITTIFVSGKRGPFLFMSIAVIAIIYIFSKKEIGRKGTLINMTFIFIVSLLGIFLIDNIEIILRLSQDYDFTSGRILLYDRAVRLFKENMIFGSGWGGFRSVYKFRDIVGYYEVHNIYLQMLCEVGVIGSLIFIIYFLRNLKLTYKAISGCGEEWKKYVYFALFGQIYFVLYGMTGNPLYDFWIYLYAVSGGCGLSLYTVSKEKKKRKWLYKN